MEGDEKGSGSVLFVVSGNKYGVRLECVIDYGSVGIPSDRTQWKEGGLPFVNIFEQCFYFVVPLVDGRDSIIR